MTISSLNALRTRRRLTGLIDPKAQGVTWWRPDGIDSVNCITAYYPKGAVSIDRSYLDVIDSSYYKCVPYVAPTFTAGSGWVFTGTQYMNAFYAPNLKPVSAVASITLPNTTGYRTVLGCNPRGGLQFRVNQTTNTINLTKADIAEIGLSSGSVATNTRTSVGFTYSAAGVYNFYLNGLASGSGTNDQTFVAGEATIGAYFSPSVVHLFNGTIHSVAIWNVVLTPAQMAQSSAMQSTL